MAVCCLAAHWYLACHVGMVFTELLQLKGSRWKGKCDLHLAVTQGLLIIFPLDIMLTGKWHGLDSHPDMDPGHSRIGIHLALGDGEWCQILYFRYCLRPSGTSDANIWHVILLLAYKDWFCLHPVQQFSTSPLSCSYSVIFLTY